MEKIKIFRKINLNSPIPFYIQVKDTIRSAIEKNLLKPGDLIPGESDLCAHFKVSRTVIRQALDDLTHEGLIVRKKGKGTFVCEPKILERFGQEITGFYQEMTSRSYQIKTEVLQQEIVPADEEIAKYLNKNIGDPLILLKRLRYLQGEPILIVSSFLPCAKCEDLLNVDFSSMSLYEVLENRMGYKLSFGQRTIEATIADSEQARLLKIERGDPLLYINSVVYLDDATPIEFYQSHYRGDRYKFEVQLIKLKEGQRPNQFSIDNQKSLPSSEGKLKTTE